VNLPNETLPDSYYTTIDVAKILGMSVRSVQLMVDHGHLQAWKTPGSHRRITRASVERWIQRSQNPLPDTHALPTAPNLTRAPSERCAHPARLLLIEDSAEYQNLVYRLVHSQLPWVELHLCQDGISGLVAFGRLQPDLVILDILMPGMDGASMITGLRRHPLFGDCKLVVLTTKLNEKQRTLYHYVLEDVPVVHRHEMKHLLPALIESALKPWMALGGAPPGGLGTRSALTTE
jgi:excisionase family DNA binding protein